MNLQDGTTTPVTMGIATAPIRFDNLHPPITHWDSLVSQGKTRQGDGTTGTRDPPATACMQPFGKLRFLPNAEAVRTNSEVYVYRNAKKSAPQRREAHSRRKCTTKPEDDREPHGPNCIENARPAVLGVCAAHQGESQGMLPHQ